MEENKIKVSTAYNVEIEYFTASAWERTLGFLIDLFIKIAYGILITVVFVTGLNVKSYWLYILLSLPYLFYSLMFEMFNNGKTVGKTVMKTQVVSLTGKNTTLGQYLIRWFARMIDFNLFTTGLAFISVVSTEKGQRIGDMLANTAVITQSDRKVSRSNLSRVKMPNGYIGKYREVLQLKDQHIQTLKQVIFNNTPASKKIQLAAAEHIMYLTGIPKSMPSKKYLKMIVYDYNYFQLLAERSSEEE